MSFNFEYPRIYQDRSVTMYNIYIYMFELYKCNVILFMLSAVTDKYIRKCNHST